MCPFIESIRVEKGEVYNLSYHEQRMNRTRAHFGGDVNFLKLSAYVVPPSDFLHEVLKCRIVYAEDIIDVSFAPYQMRNVASLRLVTADNIDYTYKSQDRKELNELFAQKGDADEILVVKNGYLTDTSIANIALYDGNSWFTPGQPLLEGTKRAELLDKKRIKMKDIKAESIGSYSHIMLFNAMIDWGKILIPVNQKNIVL